MLVEPPFMLVESPFMLVDAFMLVELVETLLRWDPTALTAAA